MLCELGLCVQSYVQEMQTTPDTNKSVTLFQKAFQNKNIDDICSKLFMIKHFSVSITITKDRSFRQLMVSWTQGRGERMQVGPRPLRLALQSKLLSSV